MGCIDAIFLTFCLGSTQSPTQNPTTHLQPPASPTHQQQSPTVDPPSHPHSTAAPAPSSAAPAQQPVQITLQPTTTKAENAAPADPSPTSDNGGNGNNASGGSTSSLTTTQSSATSAPSISSSSGSLFPEPSSGILTTASLGTSASSDAVSTSTLSLQASLQTPPVSPGSSSSFARSSGGAALFAIIALLALAVLFWLGIVLRRRKKRAAEERMTREALGDGAGNAELDSSQISENPFMEASGYPRKGRGANGQAHGVGDEEMYEVSPTDLMGTLPMHLQRSTNTVDGYLYSHHQYAQNSTHDVQGITTSMPGPEFNVTSASHAPSATNTLSHSASGHIADSEGMYGARSLFTSRSPASAKVENADSGTEIDAYSASRYSPPVGSVSFAHPQYEPSTNTTLTDATSRGEISDSPFADPRAVAHLRATATSTEAGHTEPSIVESDNDDRERLPRIVVNATAHDRAASSSTVGATERNDAVTQLPYASSQRASSYYGGTRVEGEESKRLSAAMESLRRDSRRLSSFESVFAAQQHRQAAFAISTRQSLVVDIPPTTIAPHTNGDSPLSPPPEMPLPIPPMKNISREMSSDQRRSSMASSVPPTNAYPFPETQPPLSNTLEEPFAHGSDVRLQSQVYLHGNLHPSISSSFSSTVLENRSLTPRPPSIAASYQIPPSPWASSSVSTSMSELENAQIQRAQRIPAMTHAVDGSGGRIFRGQDDDTDTITGSEESAFRRYLQQTGGDVTANTQAR